MQPLLFDDSLRVVVSGRLKAADAPTFQKATLVEIEGHELRLPYRFAPDPVALAYHREHVFAE